MKKVLFIAYNFPPHGGPGVQRSLKFVKYLREFGWEPIVVSSAENAGVTQDEALLNDIPKDTAVYRVDAFSPGRMVAMAKRVRLDYPVRVMNVLLALPDPMRWWAWRAQRHVAEIIKKHKPDIVYTTSGPYSSHLLGRWIKEQFGLPWLADFRDPWSSNLVIPYPPGYRWLNRRLECSVLAKADAVSCVSEPWLNELRYVLGRSSEKFRVIENGFDPDDIVRHPPRENEKIFTITHLGSFYPNRRPDTFIEAVKELITEGKIDKHKIACRFVGENARNYVPQAEPFEPLGYVSHRAAQEFVGRTDALLLILAADRRNIGNYSGKIYEYIACNRPILGIVPPGGVAEKLIHDTRTGITVDGAVANIKRALLELYRMWLDGKNSFQPDWQEINRHTRFEATRLLAERFQTLSSR